MFNLPQPDAIKVKLDLVTIVGPAVRFEVFAEGDERLIHIEKLEKCEALD
ncbi:hypothetical protein [Alishewanella longhuensis]